MGGGSLFFKYFFWCIALTNVYFGLYQFGSISFFIYVIMIYYEKCKK